MSKGADVLFFDAIFSIMLIAFGAASGTANFTALHALPAPTLAPQPGNIKCSQYDFTCQATAGIAQATAYIGWAVVNGPVVVIFLIIEFIIFINILLTVTFSSSFSPNGVPFLGIAFIGLQIYVVWDLISTLPFSGGRGI